MSISLEPLANKGNSDGQGLLVTPISEVGAISHRTAITVSDVAQEITIGAGKNSIEFQNSGTKTIYYGGTGVSSAGGGRLFPDETKVYTKVKLTFSIYFVCAAAETSTLRILEYA